MKWQPIETAPKDGTEVLVVRVSEEYDTPWANVCSYFAGRWMVNAQGDQEMQPTHWMPIPEPPE